MFFCLQPGIPHADHAGEKSSRKAKRLEDSERRGILAYALLKPFIFSPLFLANSS